MKALFVALLLAGAPPPKSPANALNAAGFELYKKGDFKGALEKFREAFQADDSHALAHYNFAATLGVFRKQKKVCEADAYKGEILDHLERSIQLDPRRKDRAKKDADLDPVRDTLRYQKNVAGLTLAKDTARVLEAVSWFGPAPGMYGNMSWVDFQPKGKVVVTVLQMGEADSPTRKAVAGTWRVAGDTVTIETKEAIGGKNRWEGKIAGDAIDFPDAIGRVTDMPSECDA